MMNYTRGSKEAVNRDRAVGALLPIFQCRSNAARVGKVLGSVRAKASGLMPGWRKGAAAILADDGPVIRCEGPSGTCYVPKFSTMVSRSITSTDPSPLKSQAGS
jgi:hypothetical protein